MTLSGEFISALEAVCKVRRGAAVAAMDAGVDEGNLAAGVVAFPDTTADVQAVIRLCRQYKVQVVPQGGRTGLAKGAVSEPGQLVLDMGCMARVGPADAVAGCIEVEAGATLQAVQEACAKAGCSPGIDLAARGSATIGGMVATNAGGMEAFRCGVMRNRVLGLEAVLPDGSVLNDLTRVRKVNEGFDIKHLLIGSEGRLGVVTRVVLALEPLEKAAATALTGFASAADAVDAFRVMNATGGLLRAEIMWRPYVEVTAGQTGLEAIPAACAGDVLVLFEMAGESHDTAADKLQDALGELPTLQGGLVAQSDAHAADFWRIREDSFAVERVWPGGLWYDVTVPLDRLDDYTQGLQVRVKSMSPDLFVSIMGHLGDGNLHITIAAPGGTSLAKDKCDAAVFYGLKDMGGSISAEHGIGLEKREAFSLHGDPARQALTRQIARTLDPDGLMNPGKIFV
ncbi:MAG: FAD-binding oxidoreductase [Anderseniella sp.]|nr:FAD-binding oxidoreductase [Anderseniella sp.]